MSEFWFDTRDGTPLIGTEAAGPRIDEAGPEIVPLVNLLTTKEFPYTTQDFEKADVSEWQREDYVAFGKWALRVINSNTGVPEQPLTERQVQRLYILGFGPERTRIRQPQRFGNFTNYQMEIGSQPSRFAGKYDDWSLERYVQHAKKLEERLGRKPEVSDYDEVASRRKGPSYQVIKAHIGGVGIIHEYLGYPDVRSWSEDDFLLWGVKVIEANPRAGMHWLMPDILGSRQRGPTMRAILDHFPSWKTYKSQVEYEHSIHLQQSTLSKQVKIERYAKMLEADKLPDSFGELNEEELVRKAARYLLLDSCAAELEEHVRLQAALDGRDNLIQIIRLARPSLDADEIERTAMEMDLHDDIWPKDDYLEHYHVADEDLFRLLREKNQARVERRKNAA